MMLNEDKRVDISVPFLQNKAVLYIYNGTGISNVYIDEKYHELSNRFKEIGYTFLYLPELAVNLFPEVLHYMLPGQNDIPLAEEMYRNIRDLANLGDASGFLYKRRGRTYFRVIPESSERSVSFAVNDFISFLEQKAVPESSSIRFSKKGDFDAPVIDFEKNALEKGPMCDSWEGLEKVSKPKRRKRIAAEKDPDDQLDPRVQAILDGWGWLSKTYGITLDGLKAILNYKLKLSRLYITFSNRIFLADLEGKPEVKLDSLSKALYFFYLKHPEGAAFKELSSYEDEVLDIYTGITGRDDLCGIRKSVSALVSPYSDGRNSCVSRIRTAFRNIVGDDIAKNYYIDGKQGEVRTVSLDRDLVIWEH